jgi:predicted  nucleic acid-binding Zn-ribbon protein
MIKLEEGKEEASPVAESGKPDAEAIKELERELQDKSLLLANLEVMIEDYRREKSRLIEELMFLREKLWDLTGQQRDSDDKPTMSGD